MKENHVCRRGDREEFYIECNLRHYGVQQGCTNPLRQTAVATKFCTLAPNICGAPSMEFCGPGSVAGIATGYRLDGSEIESR